MHYERLLQQLVDVLKQVQGLRAIVLGGSYASGSQRPDSDIDIGLYYYEDQLLDIEHIRAIASQFNDTPDPVVTDLGGWERGLMVVRGSQSRASASIFSIGTLILSRPRSMTVMSVPFAPITGSNLPMASIVLCIARRP